MSEETEVWHEPTRWFGPGWMGKTALRHYLVKTFGEFLDKRELQRNRTAPVLTRSADEELIVDFIADTGDGFNATYSVFRQLNPAHMGHPDILLCGGDQIYPDPSARAYEEKFVAPLRDAVPMAYVDHVRDLVDRGDTECLQRILGLDTDNEAWLGHQRDLVAPLLAEAGLADLLESHGIEPPAEPPSDADRAQAARPWLLAIPGNHDWYDGLSAFDQIFMHEHRIGAFDTKQNRSYWAVSLEVGGKRWWIWGIDLALDAHVDRTQLDYFVACGAEPGEPVVLVLAAPLWTYAPHRIAHLYEFERKAVFDKKLRLALVLSGDRHYYIRREAILEAEDGGRRDDAPPRITAGLGGAFTHAPHLEMVTPGLWEDIGHDNGAPNHNLKYRAAQLKPRDTGRSRRSAERPRSFPAEKESRRASSLRRSVSSWFRWNRSFTLIPFVLGLLAAATMLQTSRFWGDEAVTQVNQWQLALYLVLSFNLMIVIVLLLLAVALSPPDPSAMLQRTQRVFWTLGHWLAQVAALWGSMWAAQEIARVWVGDAEDEVEGLVFILLAAAFAAIAFVTVLVGYFAITTRAQMSVNALGSWSLDTNYAGFMRMRFTADRIFVDVYGMTDIKTEKPSKIWRRRTGRTELHPRIEPCWERRPLVHVDEFDVSR